MKRRNKLCIGMSIAPTWLSREGWRAPDSGIEGLFSAEFALDIAKRAEAAHLDFVFRPDVNVLPVDALEESFGFASLDATVLFAALAMETRNIGLVTTISTTFTHPYLMARQLMSLHWMSNGRAGCNLVTALQGNENFGLNEMPSSEIRHRRASEFVEALNKLWRSFPSDALIIDRQSGRFANTEAIKPADHCGEAFQIKGPLNLPSFPVAEIPLMQAGGSPYGVDFAGQVADMVFGRTPDMSLALQTQKNLGRAAQSYGRNEHDVRLLPGLSLYLAPTRAEAQDLFMANHTRLSDASKIARLRDLIGLDLSDWPENRPVRQHDLPILAKDMSPLSHTLHRWISETEPTKPVLLSRPEALASPHWQIVGTVDDAAREISQWFEAGAIDGFIALPGGSWSSLKLTLEELVPRLTDIGIFRSTYSGDTLAHHLNDPL